MPLGHTAIGLVAFETARPTQRSGSRLALFAYITILANLPDLDILVGLLFTGNGAAFHRGPTHSLLFALAMGYLASRLMRRWRGGPQLNVAMCALLIFSHVAADLLLTSAPVSLLWPLELNFSMGYSDWGNVIQLAIFQSVQDFVIAALAGIYLFTLRKMRGTTVVRDLRLAVFRRGAKSER
jgi:membrane-bound metal-dependent hydrolase YbcI (DUF457 family)